MTPPSPALTAPLYNAPLPWFDAWIKEAREANIREHNACCLSTVSATGQPSGRMVLLKEWDEEGFVFYTNLESRKGREALATPFASMTFHWRSLERQVRIEGPLHQISDARADAYFATRSRGSQVGAWASDQSRPLSDRDTLIANAAAAKARHEGEPIPRPPHWSGLCITPVRVEFWSAGADRLHDRFEFSRADTSSPWSLQRLFP